MAFISKSGAIVANKGYPIKIFATLEAYTAWEATLPSPEATKEYIIIKKYEPVESAGTASLLINNMKLGLHLPLQADYFTMTSPFTMTVVPRFTTPGGTMKYSIDNGTTWAPITSGNPTLPAKVIKFKGTMPGNTLFKNESSSNQWGINGSKVLLSGDITTLLNENGGVDTLGNYGFASMFRENTAIMEANITLPKIMGAYSADSMFLNCGILLVAPTLPATTLGERCYKSMFEGCGFLTTPPALPATNLAVGCYTKMFQSCAYLNTAPILPATTLADECYSVMFSGCSALTTPPALPATNLAIGCYYNMFFLCGLTSAPVLPAMTLTNYCYHGMFSNCMSLTTAPLLPATTLANNCYMEMFGNCTSLISAPELPATTLPNYCYAQMFNGCSSFTTLPELLVTTLTVGCYEGMFQSCTGLTAIRPLNFGNVPCADNMFSLIPNLFSATRTGVYQTPVTTAVQQNTFSNLGVFAPGTIYGKGGTPPPEYFTITSDTPMTVAPVFTTPSGTMKYSIDNGTTWAPITSGTATPSATTIKFKGEMPGHTLYNSVAVQNKWNITNGTNVCLGGDITTVLTESGKLNTIGDYAFANMFRSQVITEANITLPENLGIYAADGMFSYCTLLTKPPVLPATVLSMACYHELFKGCTKLSIAPELPATTLASYCYYEMFATCSALVNAPILPATTLAENCYLRMFDSCSSFTIAPQLPATTLANKCYKLMFLGCINITTMPDLPATTLAIGCYQGMFDYCTGLTSVKSMNFGNVNSSNLMFTNIPALFSTTRTGVYQIPVTTEVLQTGFSNLGDFAPGTIYGKGTLPPPKTFTMTSDTPMTVTPKFTVSNGTMKYSIDNETNWVPITSGTATPSANVINFKGEMPGNRLFASVDYNNTWTITGGTNVRLDGDITTLLAESGRVDTAGDFAFSEMFYNQNSITEANISLPNAVGTYCAYQMFYLCTSLKVAPQLPAMVLAEECYDGMFQSCAALVNAPELPAMTLAKDCYTSMFQGCSSLFAAPSLPATTLANSCYYKMFNGSTIVNAPALPATTLITHCYNSMFYGCNSLVAAPALPATTLAQHCYSSMFYGCGSLTNAPVLPATTLANTCYGNMFNGCSALVNAPALPATTLTPGCYYNMFMNCWNLGAAPALPATTLTPGCYENMFYNCATFTAMPDLPATTLAIGCYSGMFYGCSKIEAVKAMNFGNVNSSNSMFNMIPNLFSATRTGVYQTPVTTTIAQITFSNLGDFAPGTIYGKGGTPPPPSGPFTMTSDSRMNVIPKFNTPGGTMKYSIDNGATWQPINSGAMIAGVTNVSFKGEMPGHSLFTNNTLTPWEVQGGAKVNLSGDITTVLTENGKLNAVGNNAFKDMFNSNTSIVEANITLPNELGESAAEGMFTSCTNLTKAPELPATILGRKCYINMFNYCPKLTVAPALPATTLSEMCYLGMFQNTAIVSAPELPATVLTNNCYQNMFKDCNKLTTAPVLPAITVKASSYSGMFYSCGSLVVPPVLPATTLNLSSYADMFFDCGSLATAPELPAMALEERCYHSMFMNCSSLTKVPNLPATTLKPECYTKMFSDCISLKSVKPLNFGNNVSGDMMFNNIPNLFAGTRGGVYQIPVTSIIAQSAFSNLGELSGTIYGKDIP